MRSCVRPDVKSGDLVLSLYSVWPSILSVLLQDWGMGVPWEPQFSGDRAAAPSARVSETLGF